MTLHVLRRGREIRVFIVVKSSDQLTTSKGQAKNAADFGGASPLLRYINLSTRKDGLIGTNSSNSSWSIGTGILELLPIAYATQTIQLRQQMVLVPIICCSLFQQVESKLPILITLANFCAPCTCTRSRQSTVSGIPILVPTNWHELCGMAESEAGEAAVSYPINSQFFSPSSSSSSLSYYVQTSLKTGRQSKSCLGCSCSSSLVNNKHFRFTFSSI